MGISQSQQELCDDRGQAMSHTRDSGDSPYHTERASLNTPLLFLPISLCLDRSQEQHAAAEGKFTDYMFKTHRGRPAQRDTIISVYKRQKMSQLLNTSFVTQCLRVSDSGGE